MQYLGYIPKIVWLLWFQGWNENTPAIISKVAHTYEFHNPTWEIHRLSNDNLAYYMDSDYFNITDISQQSKSDYIRLTLMAKYGGVWADATMACFYPLEEWIGKALGKTAFWAYHGRDRSRGPASWFMMSRPRSHIAVKWREAAVEYWKIPRKQINYFWMDELFGNLARENDRFRQKWQNVGFTAYLDCENDEGSAHYAMRLLARGGGGEQLLRDIQTKITPYVLKLRWHDPNLLPYYEAVLDWAATKREPTAKREVFLQQTIDFYNGAVYYP